MNAILLAVMLALSTVWPARVAAPHLARVALAPVVNCSATTLTLQPGLHPPPPRPSLRIAADVPRGSFTAPLPVYPGATPLTPYVASPFPDYPDNPYVQTASAEYQSEASVATLRAWFWAMLPACGWHVQGFWNGNATAFTSGMTFIANDNANLTVDVSFGSGPSGSAYLGYGVEEITYPPRPASSFLHGPFTEIRIALQRSPVGNEPIKPYVVHTTMQERASIAHLVRAINAIMGYHSTAVVCMGGPARTVGPAWLSFVRPNGTVVHAYESGPGVCGGLAVNGLGWLIDPGFVWNEVLSLTGGRG